MATETRFICDRCQIEVRQPKEFHEAISLSIQGENLISLDDIGTHIELNDLCHICYIELYNQLKLFKQWAQPIEKKENINVNG
jgi:hypothetical protein